MLRNSCTVWAPAWVVYRVQRLMVFQCSCTYKPLPFLKKKLIPHYSCFTHSQGSIEFVTLVAAFKIRKIYPRTCARTSASIQRCVKPRWSAGYSELWRRRCHMHYVDNSSRYQAEQSETRLRHRTNARLQGRSMSQGGQRSQRVATQIYWRRLYAWVVASVLM